jgi:decaprenylphospho-beta-D-erythro-pentofuranosid-2-ulose 2-reductase
MQILIIGGNSDIGFEIAKEFYKNNNNNLYLTTQPNKKITKDINQLKNHKNRLKLIKFDLLEFNNHKKFYNALDPKPDLVICSAGMFLNSEQILSNFELKEKMINTNFTGYASILDIIIDDFKRKNNGCIIGISSVAGDRGRASNYMYGSTKSAFSSYLSGLRNSLKKFNINIITIKPGFVKTKMTNNIKMNKYLTATPEKVAKDVHKAWKRKKDIVYTPWYWKYIIIIIKIIPEKIFKKMNL